jgi:hypothetical protein
MVGFMSCGRNNRSKDAMTSEQKLKLAAMSELDEESVEMIIFKEVFNGLDISVETKMELSKSANLHAVVRSIRLVLSRALSSAEPSASVQNQRGAISERAGCRHRATDTKRTACVEAVYPDRT